MWARVIPKSLFKRQLTAVWAAFSPAARLGVGVLGAGFALISLSFASSSDRLPMAADRDVASSYRPLNAVEERNRDVNPWQFSHRQQVVYGSPHRVDATLWPPKQSNNVTTTSGNRPWGNVVGPTKRADSRYAALARKGRTKALASYSYGDLNPYDSLPIRPISLRKPPPPAPLLSFWDGPERMHIRPAERAVSRPQDYPRQSPRRTQSPVWGENRPW